MAPSLDPNPRERCGRALPGLATIVADWEFGWSYNNGRSAMELWMLLVLAVIVGGAINAAIQAESGNALAQKFAELGTLRGRTKAEIIAAVGEPTAISMVGDDKTLLQWQQANYHVALRFTGETCDGVTHEALVKPQ